MALHDRAYMKRAASAGPSAGRVAGWVIGLHVAGVVFGVVADGWFRHGALSALALSWDALAAGRLWTPLTHALVEPLSAAGAFTGVLAYLLLRVVEDVLGARRCAVFVAVTLFGAALAQIAAGLVEVRGPWLGARAFGLTGVAAGASAFALVRARDRRLWLPWISPPAWVGVLVLGAIVVAARAEDGPPTSPWAPLGAAAFGAVTGALGRLPELRVPRATPRPAKSSGQETRDRVDALLDKISAEGMSSLTAEEREFLERASKQY